MTQQKKINILLIILIILLSLYIIYLLYSFKENFQDIPSCDFGFFVEQNDDGSYQCTPT